MRCGKCPIDTDYYPNGQRTSEILERYRYTGEIINIKYSDNGDYLCEYLKHFEGWINLWCSASNPALLPPLLPPPPKAITLKPNPSMPTVVLTEAQQAHIDAADARADAAGDRVRLEQALSEVPKLFTSASVETIRELS